MAMASPCSTIATATNQQAETLAVPHFDGTCSFDDVATRALWASAEKPSSVICTSLRLAKPIFSPRLLTHCNCGRAVQRIEVFFIPFRLRSDHSELACGAWNRSPLEGFSSREAELISNPAAARTPAGLCYQSRWCPYGEASRTTTTTNLRPTASLISGRRRLPHSHSLASLRTPTNAVDCFLAVSSLMEVI